TASATWIRSAPPSSPPRSRRPGRRAGRSRSRRRSPRQARSSERWKGAAVAELPSGTVTFLFTDVEGPTRLGEAQPQAVPAALARHDQLLHGVIAGHGGAVFKTVGDAFCAAFASPLPALQAAVALQHRLRVEPFPIDGVLRVRVALHTGVAE